MGPELDPYRVRARAGVYGCVLSFSSRPLVFVVVALPDEHSLPFCSIVSPVCSPFFLLSTFFLLVSSLFYLFQFLL